MPGVHSFSFYCRYTTSSGVEFSNPAPYFYFYITESFEQNDCHNLKLNSMGWVRERMIPTERPPLSRTVPTFVDRGCRVVSAKDPHGRIFGFLDRSRYFFFQVPPKLCLRGWVDPIPDPLLLIKSGSTGNRTRDLWICSQKLWPLDHRGGHFFLNNTRIFLTLY
jgi:hypothetical protein